MFFMQQERRCRPSTYRRFDPRNPPHCPGTISDNSCGYNCPLITTIVCVILTLIVLATYTIFSSVKIRIVYVDTENPGVSSSSKFLSIGLDSSVIANGFKGFNMTNPKLLKLVKALSPGYLRVGGTMADRLIFSPKKSRKLRDTSLIEDGGVCSYNFNICDYFDKPNFTMSGQDWLQLNRFSRNANLDLLFDLNSLRRFANGSWDYQNAEELIRFSSKHNLTVNWELGNEPNAFKHQFNYEVNSSQLAEDFKLLKSILAKYPKYRSSLLVGPDTTRPRVDHKESEVYLKGFLTHAPQTIDAITWHQYYFDGRTAKAGDFLDPEVFDILKWQIVAAKEIAKFAKVPTKPMWLGETSSAYGGGAPGLSDRFIATFIWLDKLAISAKMGLDVVIRQSIFKGNYALIDVNYNPTPDWWVSILYKKLVGPKTVHCYTSTSRRVRLYCQCTKPSATHNTDSITVFGMNLASVPEKVRIEGIVPMDIDAAYYNVTVHSYTLTAGHLSIVSRKIFLNGNELQLTETNDLPVMRPKIVVANPYIEIPAYSIVFWIVPGENLSSC